MLSGIRMIVILVFMIHLTDHRDCLLNIHILYFHHTAHTLRERCSNKDTDMWNVLTGKYNVCTSSDYDHIFLLGKFADQITLFKEQSILLGQTMVAAERTRLLDIRTEFLLISTCDDLV